MKVIYANTFKKKLKGLMFKKEFDYIMKFKCNGIHTFFMKKNIDVYLTDKDKKILYIYRDLKPNRIIFPKKHVKYTYETKVNYLNNISVGDTFKIKEDSY